MSNYLAIATATATLRTLLQNAVTPNVPGVSVNTTRPHAEVNDNPPTEITIYLFQVTPNAAFRNADLPTRRAGGALMQRPTAALDLHYMLSFYGNEQQLEPQRMLGIVARTLHAHPYLTRDMIRETIQNNPGILGGSDLGEQIELIKFSPLHLSLEEFSKIWSVFYEIPYVLSIAYQASVVLIEEDAPTQSVLPVLTRNVYAVPFHQPVNAPHRYARLACLLHTQLHPLVQDCRQQIYPLGAKALHIIDINWKNDAFEPRARDEHTRKERNKLQIGLRFTLDGEPDQECVGAMQAAITVSLETALPCGGSGIFLINGIVEIEGNIIEWHWDKEEKMGLFARFFSKYDKWLHDWFDEEEHYMRVRVTKMQLRQRIPGGRKANLVRVLIQQRRYRT